MKNASAGARYRHILLATTVVSAIALPQIVSAFDATSSDGRIIVAQKDDPKKKQATPPPKAPTPPPPPKAPPPPPQKSVQPPQQPKIQQQQPQQKSVQPQQQQPKIQQQPQQKSVQPSQQPKIEPKQKSVQPQQGQQPKFEPKQVQPQQGQKKFEPKQVQPQPGQQPQIQQQPKQVQPQPGQQPQIQQQPKQVQPQPGQQPQIQQQPKQVQPQPGQQPQIQQQPKQVQPQPGQQPQLQPQQKQVVQPKQPPVQIQKFGAPKTVSPDARTVNVNEVKGKRREEKVGNTVVIVEPGNRQIFREGGRVFIRHDESERMRRWGNARFETRGNERYTIVNRGGYDVVTITDGRGHMLRRFRRFPDGREYALIDNRRRWGGAAVVGGVVIGGAIVAGLMMPRITIPRERYIVNMETAPPAYLYEALESPPLVAMERPYTLDEVRDNYELRARVPSVDINTINFATGSWEITPDQIPRLQGLAEAMLKVISENPATVFLIEGHTDAVGAAEDNMSLSDRRAEAVAEVLTTNFNIPPENLVTQGYGEQHLRVQTDGPSRENRRVEVRNVTGLMAAGQGEQDGQPGGPPPGPPPG